MKLSTFFRILYFASAFSLLLWVLFGGNKQSHIPPMTQALESCVEACNNDTSAPHRVGAGEVDEVYVDCWCQGYKKYDYISDSK